MELIVLPDYTASHPSVTFAFVVTEKCVACIVFISLVERVTFVTPCTNIKYKMAGIFSNITRFATKF